MARPAIEVVHVGSACRDITPDDPRGWRLGGGVTYAALTTARLGLRTAAVIGVDEAGAGATSSTCCATPASTSSSSRSPRGRSSTTRDARRAGPDLPRARRAARRPRLSRRRGWRRAAWSLVPVAGEVPDDWAAASRRTRPGRRRLAGVPARARGRASGSRAARPARRRCVAPGRPRRGEPSRRRVRDEPGATLGGLLRPGADLLVTAGRAAAGCWSASARTARARPSATCRPRPTARSTRPVPATRSWRRCWRRSCGRRSSGDAVAPGARPAVRGRGRLAGGRGSRA